MIKNTLKRFVNEDAGMEMVEWSIVGVVFALGAATIWGGSWTGPGSQDASRMRRSRSKLAARSSSIVPALRQSEFQARSSRWRST